MAEARKKVLVTYDILPAAVALLRESCDVWVWTIQDYMPREDLLRKAVGVNGILVQIWDKVDKELLDVAGPHLKVVSTMSTGVDHIDLAECRKRGIKVGHTPGVLMVPVAEMTIGLTLAAARRFKEAFAQVSEDKRLLRHRGAYLIGKSLQGSIVGIVGLGRIGSAVAERLKGFDVAQILYCSNTKKSYDIELGAKFVPFKELLNQSDFVIVCCSMDDSNRGLFNRHAFSQMKKSSVFVNVARGQLVKHSDLYEALTNGHLFSAALDVTDPEPINKDDPLLTLENCTITPHVAPCVEGVVNKVAELSAKNILAGFNNECLSSFVC